MHVHATALTPQDLTTPNSAALQLALASLPTLLAASAQLSSDLHPELVKQLSSSRPAIRRSAVLVLGQVWASVESGDIVSQHELVERLRERLNDDDSSVVGATANVLLELVRRSAPPEAITPLLALAPELFGLLTSSNNNWMLIKIIKIVRPLLVSG